VAAALFAVRTSGKVSDMGCSAGGTRMVSFAGCDCCPSPVEVMSFRVYRFLEFYHGLMHSTYEEREAKRALRWLATANLGSGRLGKDPGRKR
jgi:hypothetical protein